MDNFIGTVVFLLPGFLMYFWIQSFGVNPVAKHSPIELTAISGLLWLPVSVATLLLYNFLIDISKTISTTKPIWTLDDLKAGTSSFIFLTVFLLLSVVVSFLFSVIWSKWGEPSQRWIINKVRKWRGVAEFSKSASVWDEVFMNDDSQVVEIGKIDKSYNEDIVGMIGFIQKASRTFEPERLSLGRVDYFTKLVRKYKIPVSNIYFDVKAGIYIKIFDPDEVSLSMGREEQEESISSESEAGS